LFQWIKQHLRIKTFYGTGENAVKTQIWIAVSLYVLVAIVRKRLTEHMRRAAEVDQRSCVIPIRNRSAATLAG
jgi:hypothetical protein